VFNNSTIMSKNILDYYQDYSNSNYLHEFQNEIQIGPMTPNYKNAFKIIKDKNQMIDDVNDYYINELGFRGILNNESEILSAGCSITFGCGVPDDGTWPYILSNKINQPIVNLGSPGRSIASICYSIILYAVKHKMPKKIFCFFPGFFRSWFVVDNIFYSSKKQTDNSNLIDHNLYLGTVNTRTFFDSKENKLFMLSRNVNSLRGHLNNNVGHKMETMLSPHQLIANSINAISTLELFCLSHNIELYWTTWDSDSNVLINTLKEIPKFKLKNYVNFLNKQDNIMFQGNQPNVYEELACTSEHSLELNDHASWNMGTDYNLQNGKKLEDVKPHPGIHFHAHIAEFFEKYSKLV
jgi:hypothetical protein